MKFIPILSLVLLLAACQSNQAPTEAATQGDSTAAATAPTIQRSPAEEKAMQTAERFYEWLISENYDAVKAMLDPASVPDAAWSDALLADLRDKRSKLGLPTVTEFVSLEQAPDATRTIHAAIYKVQYSLGFLTEETLFFLDKGGRFYLLDYGYENMK